MFAIALKADRYLTYVLTDSDAKARLEVVPERGGLITRWQIGGEDVLYFDEERFADPLKSVRGGIPILFPICGNLPDNTYQLDGQNYTLKQHGFARDLPWTVVQQDVKTAAELTLELTSNDETRSRYPFEFRLAFTYRLHGHSLELHMQFTNLSDRPMPFSTGLHPYFQVNDKTQLSFDIPSSEYLDQITGGVHSFDGSFDFGVDEIDIAFKNLTASTATVIDTHLNRKLTLSWSDAYPALVFWTVKGKDYYCLEPWTAYRNAMNTGEHLLHLEPQQSYTTQITLAASQP